jgi:hypothetical protein
VGPRGGAPFRDEGNGLNIANTEDVLAAAQTYARLCASGIEPEAPFYSVVMAAARHYDMLEDPVVLTAARWQEWLHPRGIDGRFMESGSMVDIFPTGGDWSTIENAHAPRRRAQIKQLMPEGALVQYFDGAGNPVKPDGDNGYPSLIPLDMIRRKVSSAPNSKARLPGVSSLDEFKQGYKSSGLSQVEYDAAITRFNAKIDAELKPERSASIPGIGRPVSDPEYNSHLDYVTEVTDLGLGKQTKDIGLGLAGESAFKDTYGNWSQEQLERMLVMADDLFAKVTEGKPTERKAIMLGGLPGSGKSALLGKMDAEGDIDRSQWVEINPDLVKEAMIEADWYPKITGLSPGETSGFIHAQSSEMASMLERMAMKDGYNLIFDVTMNGVWTDNTINLLSAHDYQGPDGIFIESGSDHALASIAYRHRKGLDALRTGTVQRDSNDDPMDVGAVFNGGRFLPSKALPTKDTEKVNVGIFDRLKARFARWAKYNVGNAPGTKPDPQLLESTPDMPGGAL